jgi:hypothetical protein
LVRLMSLLESGYKVLAKSALLSLLPGNRPYFISVFNLLQIFGTPWALRRGAIAMALIESGHFAGGDHAF